MARTDSFRKHHNEILAYAREINALLGPAMTDEQIESSRKLLAKLAGLVTLHLAMEDQSLYPELKSCQDTTVRATAEFFSKEMGKLATEFTQYLQSWQTSSMIRANPGRFSSESKAIFNSLSRRIHRENTELYPLLDAM